MFDAISRIEISVRTRFIYELATEYGPFPFKKENFVLTYDKKNMIYMFSKMSPAGQDFNFEVDIGCDIEDFARNIYKTFMDYDISCETYLWLDNTGHGKNGAPFDLEDVLEDIKACEQYIQDAHTIVCRYIDGLRR